MLQGDGQRWVPAVNGPTIRDIARYRPRLTGGRVRAAMARLLHDDDSRTLNKQ